VSETRATTPVFPPGRYGRRRDGRRRLLLPAVLAVLVGITAVFLVVRLYGRYGDPNYDAQIVGWSDVTDRQLTIRFTVRVPAGGSATCGLRARDYAGAEVGPDRHRRRAGLGGHRRGQRGRRDDGQGGGRRSRAVRGPRLTDLASCAPLVSLVIRSVRRYVPSRTFKEKSL